ncbi:MAG: TatD family hydrolase [Proteiniphilum sp.]|jgi:TatD DNase family protein|nr:TatD family hydrolase [Proteiniphilum sp.]MDD2726341.1 TatD family hydrolase [Proteiniphilum sp.]MDD3332271.1 TatD family hydrolase [Proteiniphilum sp.]MDD3556235.1 TatD family hydrolase [Proteiniphilum sp.]MDD3979649.1 TatD family hydrolase [Proteiniphilum sp.]
MRFIDTHAHLFLEEFKSDIDAVVTRARSVGVEKVLLPNIDETTLADLKTTVAYDPLFFYPMMGLHPTSVTKEWKQQLELIGEELDSDAYVAIGEIGIDLYWDRSLRAEQLSAFEEQLRWSIERDLPVSIHFRNAVDEVIRCIKRVGSDRLRGVFHSFGGSKEELQQILELKQFMIGINGVVTFKNSGLAATVADCPRERVLLETDAPYLAPVPYRGKRNESSYISHVATMLASIWQMSVEQVADITSENAIRLFNRTGRE